MVPFRQSLCARTVCRALSTQSSSRLNSVPITGEIKYDGPHNNTEAGKNPAFMGSQVKSLSPSPLSALPTGVLARSLFINSISSRPYLLGPAISFMSFLCQPKKYFLFDINRNKILAGIMRKVVYRHFCAGETGIEVKATLKMLRKMGFHGCIITYAPETVFDYNRNVVHDAGIEKHADTRSDLCPNIENWRKGVLDTIDMLGQGDQLALKITGAGHLVTDALAAGKPLPKQMYNALRSTSDLCKRRQVRLLIDAESQLYQDGILKAGLDLMREYNRDGYALVYSTYQAYLKSTPSAIEADLKEALNGNFTLGLKLVRGAYLATEKRSLIHDTKQGTDDAYNAIAHGALRKQFGSFGAQPDRPFPSVNLLLAGHNKESVFSANALHQQRLRDGLPTVPVGFAQLQGMSDEVSFGLLQLKQKQATGPEVYKCSTWGTLIECLGYLTRRACENRDAASRTVDEYKALKKEAKNRFLSLFTFNR